MNITPVLSHPSPALPSALDIILRANTLEPVINFRETLIKDPTVSDIAYRPDFPEFSK